MPNVKTYITYFDDKQISEFNLQQSDDVVLFKGNDTTVAGKNINHLNKYYCELCTLYYVWKNNLKSDYVKFQQYRRPFNTDGLPLPNTGCAYVFEPAVCVKSVYDQFYWCHYKNVQRLDLVLDWLIVTYGQQNKYTTYITSSTTFITNNTFLMHWNDFCSMCEFVFAGLEYLSSQMLHIHTVDEYEKEAYRLDGSFNKYPNVDRQEYNSRFMAYIGERLVSCWLFNHMFLKFVPFENQRYFQEYK